MGEALDARYWCYRCSQIVTPVMELEIKCPYCDSGFVQEMGGRGIDTAATDLASDRSLSLRTPILLSMLGGPSWHFRLLRREGEEGEDSGRDRELELILRRLRRSSAIIRLLQALHERTRSESENPESEGERDRERERGRERVILINPFNQAIILQGSFDTSQTDNQSSGNGSTGVSLGDYVIGPGLDLLLQYLAENDPNQYGTPPAQKEAVEAMPTVKIKENMNCSVCLEDFEIGNEAREMPCKHKFHNGCILPWLELHSSCPICRFQMPTEGSKNLSEGNVDNGAEDTNNEDGGVDNGAEDTNNEDGGVDNGAEDTNNEDGGDDNRAEDTNNEDGANDNRAEATGNEDVGNRSNGGNGENGRRFWVRMPWPFNGLFSSSDSQNNGASSSTAAHRSQAEEN